MHARVGRLARLSRHLAVVAARCARRSHSREPSVAPPSAPPATQGSSRPQPRLTSLCNGVRPWSAVCANPRVMASRPKRPHPDTCVFRKSCGSCSRDSPSVPSGSQRWFGPQTWHRMTLALLPAIAHPIPPSLVLFALGAFEQVFEGRDLLPRPCLSWDVGAFCECRRRWKRRCRSLCRTDRCQYWLPGRIR